ncbi:MAG: pirin family protein [Gammaproteobacteria bacterium]|nr:pirin family protein [Gammaproteobacteria bacterium]
MTQATKNRSVAKLVKGIPAADGAGVKLTRIIGSPELDMVDPFLLLDYFESDNPDDYIGGFPSHPHRGFETVTYLLAGRMRHEDNKGHAGVIEPGGVQWMTAGSGIVHSEMPEQENGLLSGFQLWVNLPAEHKMTKPQYREFDAGSIPSEQRDEGVEVRVITGATSNGTSGPVTDVLTEPLYLDITLSANSELIESIPESHNAFIYVINGEVLVCDGDDASDISVEKRMLAVLSEGEQVHLKSLEENTRLLLVAGLRINELVARGGPFVMNTKAEVMQAFKDYQEGRF